MTVQAPADAPAAGEAGRVSGGWDRSVAVVLGRPQTGARRDEIAVELGHAFVDPQEFRLLGNRKVARSEVGRPAIFSVPRMVELVREQTSRAEDAVAYGPVDQGGLLQALGIDARTQALAARSPDRAEALRADRDRLVEDVQMGTLFKAIAITSRGWPMPAGFAA